MENTVKLKLRLGKDIHSPPSKSAKKKVTELLSGVCNNIPLRLFVCFQDYQKVLNWFIIGDPGYVGYTMPLAAQPSADSILSAQWHDQFAKSVDQGIILALIFHRGLAELMREV